MSTNPKLIKHSKLDLNMLINDILLNKALATSEKGLLSLMFAVPDDWKCSVIGLGEFNMYSGERIFTTLENLEKKGFIKREQLYDENGEKSGASFHVYGEPQKNLC